MYLDYLFAGTVSSGEEFGTERIILHKLHKAGSSVEVWYRTGYCGTAIDGWWGCRGDVT